MSFKCGIQEECYCKYWVEPNDILTYKKFDEINTDLTRRLGRASWTGQGNWVVRDYKFWFRNEQDRTFFILKWLASDDDKRIVYPFRAFITDEVYAQYQIMKQWCEQQFEESDENSIRWLASGFSFWFRDEQDRNLFILKWL